MRKKQRDLADSADHSDLAADQVVSRAWEESKSEGSPALAVVAFFIGGETTASNPCVLAMIPLLMSVVAGTESMSIRNSLGFSGLFVLGLSITFSILGLISALMGRMPGDVGPYWKYLVSGVCLIMGLLIGIVSIPCAVSILAVLLAYVGNFGNVLYGGFLLFIYVLGHSALILIAGISMGAAKKLFESKDLRRANLVLQGISGVVIILVGAYFLFWV